MTYAVDQVVRQVTATVAGGRSVAPDGPERVTARELTFEVDSVPYPEVSAAFAEFARITGAPGTLLGYKVRSAFREDDIQARVTVTVEVDSRTAFGEGLAEDVVAASVRAFADAIER